eukprot:4146409-Amphidinium_carterae.1
MVLTGPFRILLIRNTTSIQLCGIPCLILSGRSPMILVQQYCRIVSGLLTGFGLDFLAVKLSGPDVDTATLQLVSVLFSSILLPGFVWGGGTYLNHASATLRQRKH